MQIIVSHMNTDFDALASIIAAKKLYPNAQMVLSDKQDNRVKQFLNIYRDQFPFVPDSTIEYHKVTELIIVDVAQLCRVSNRMNDLREDEVKVIVYDHHPPKEEDVIGEAGIVEPIGATVTLLIEEIRKRNIAITSFEATIFGLGIYTDTGFFTYNTTTARDLAAASYLMECGMNLDIIRRFTEQILVPEQQDLFQELFVAAKTFEKDGLEIVLTTYEQEHFQAGLAVIAEKIMKMKAANAVVAVVRMKHHVYIVGRANSKRINLLPLLKKFNGGGHKQAGSATVKRADYATVLQDVTDYLDTILLPPITATDIMTSPVKFLTEDTTIAQAGEFMYRYGHSGYPVVNDEKLIGIITRRDLDKANHHGLGHAPVKAYMSTNVFTITPDTTLEEIQKIIIEHNIGRLPVLADGKLIGIVTRTNIIEMIHAQEMDEANEENNQLRENVYEEMKSRLPAEVFSVLEKISKTANRVNVPVYLIGGIVRDILLEKENDDIDLVVEGDGIAFCKHLQKDYGGEVIIHESFGTATWKHPSQMEIDVASSRLEYYDRPASLPEVEQSTLKEDLYRRDFTINAMGICLNEDKFGDLFDPFAGQLDLYEGKVKVLHNLSYIEDPTRILRAIRFEIRFNFKMDEQTEQLALHSIDKIKALTPTRIMNEMKKLFQERKYVPIIERLYELNFWKLFKITDDTRAQSVKHAEQLQLLLQQNDEQNNENWLLFFLIPFYQSNHLDAAEKLILTKEERKLWEQISEIYTLTFDGTKSLGDIHMSLKNLIEPVLLFYAATQDEENQRIMLEYNKKRNNFTPYITGNDLREIGVRPGPLYKAIFSQLEKAIMNGEIHSKEQAITFVNHWIERKERDEQQS